MDYPINNSSASASASVVEAMEWSNSGAMQDQSIVFGRTIAINPQLDNHLITQDSNQVSIINDLCKRTITEVKNDDIVKGIMSSSISEKEKAQCLKILLGDIVEKDSEDGISMEFLLKINLTGKLDESTISYLIKTLIKNGMNLNQESSIKRKVDDNEETIKCLDLIHEKFVLNPQTVEDILLDVTSKNNYNNNYYYYNDYCYDDLMHILKFAEMHNLIKLKAKVNDLDSLGPHRDLRKATESQKNDRIKFFHECRFKFHVSGFKSLLQILINKNGANTRIDTIDLLFNLGATPDTKSKDNLIFLLIDKIRKDGLNADQEQNVIILIKKLVELGANINYISESGETVLDIVKHKISNSDKIVQTLLDFGADDTVNTVSKCPVDAFLSAKSYTDLDRETAELFGLTDIYTEKKEKFFINHKESLLSLKKNTTEVFKLIKQSKSFEELFRKNIANKDLQAIFEEKNNASFLYSSIKSPKVCLFMEYNNIAIKTFIKTFLEFLNKNNNEYNFVGNIKESSFDTFIGSIEKRSDGTKKNFYFIINEDIVNKGKDIEQCFIKLIMEIHCHISMNILQLENKGLHFSTLLCKGVLVFRWPDHIGECEITTWEEIADLVDFNNMVVNKQKFLEITGIEITKNSLELFNILHIFQKLVFIKNLLSHKNLALYQQMHR